MAAEPGAQRASRSEDTRASNALPGLSLPQLDRCYRLCFLSPELERVAKETSE